MDQPSFDKTTALQLCAANGHLEQVQLLLEAGADPTSNHQMSVHFACIYNHPQVMHLLLKHPKVDASAFNNHLLIYAARLGFIEIIELLMKQPHVDPRARNHEAILLAILGGHVHVVNLLIKDPRVDITKVDWSMIQSAMQTKLGVKKYTKEESSDSDSSLSRIQKGRVTKPHSLKKLPGIQSVLQLN